MTTETKRLLIVDDDPELLKFLVYELGSAGHECIGCANGLDALVHWRQENFDLVVLDWKLPDFSGIELCRRLRRSGNTTPILMITSRDGVDERVSALDAGVDDYLTKPFQLKELHARIRAQLRRVSYERESKGADIRFSLGNLVLDPIKRCAKRGNKKINLSKREFDLLMFLLKNQNELLTREVILNEVWGEPFIGDPNTLDVYIGYLRKKIETSGELKLFHNVRGVGFIAREGEAKP